MKEQTRQFYLSALGIDVWQARYPLPGAAPSPVQSVEEVREAAPPGPVTTERPVSMPEPGKPPEFDQVKSVLEEEAPVDPVAEDEEFSSLPAQDSAPPSESTGALCSVFWHGSHLSLAADLAADAGMDTQLRLGANIMRALDGSAVPHEIFHWPAFQNRAVPGNDDATLERLLHAMAEASVSRSWLLLGPDTVQSLSSLLRDQAHGIWLSSELTLNGLAANGNAKRELWAQVMAKQQNPDATASDG